MIEMNNKRNCHFLRVLLLLMFLGCHSLYAIVINEIMVKNVSAHINDDFNYVGWVEVFNSGHDSLDLSQFYFSDDKNDLFKYQIKTDGTLIAPNGFEVFYFDELNKAFHVNFKLDADGGIIYLVDSEGNVSDFVTYPKPFRNASYGRLNDGSDELVLLSTITPHTTNNGASICSGQVLKPMFNIKSGFYENELVVSIISETNNAKIYYSIDGSEPSEGKSTLFEDEIVISGTTTLRAIAYKEGLVPSEISTASYFIDSRDINLPVISIVADSMHLYSDDFGLFVVGENGAEIPSWCGTSFKYANYYNDWDRPANFEFFDNEKKLLINQEVKIGNFGGCSRNNFLKSIKVNTSKVYGNNKLNCSIFSEKKNIKLKSVVLRNSGNDFKKSYLRDAFMQALLIDRMDIDYQAYQPAVVFINGIYKGILNIRERSNKDYLYSNYGLDEEEFDIVSGSGIWYKDKNGRNVYANETYGELVDLLNSELVNTSEGLSEICSFLDVNEVLNYFVAEIYSANSDWPASNMKCWRKIQDGKFRYILYDTDFGFSLYGDNYTYNGFKNAESNPIYAGLMNNDEIKNLFIDKMILHLASTFENDRVVGVLDTMTNAIESEIVFFREYLKNEGLDMPDWDSEIERMKNFSKNRPQCILSQMNDFFELGDTLRLDIISNQTKAKFRINNEPVLFEQMSLINFYGRSVKIEALPVAGYNFKHWEVSDGKEVNDSVLNIVLYENTEVRAVYEKNEGFISPEIPLYINEVCASNKVFSDEEFETEDWIEIYNASSEDMNIGGLYISDDTTNLLKFRISDTIPSLTTIPARGYVTLWADKDIDQGVLHLDFELPKSRSQTIVLSKDLNGKIVIIDSVSYVPHESSESYARNLYYPQSIWSVTSKPTFAKQNLFCFKMDERPIEVVLTENNFSDMEFGVYYEDFTDLLYVLNAKLESDFWIVGIDGRIVNYGTLKTNIVDVSALGNGVYIFVLNIGEENIGVRFLKN